jgi:hypothetical protein
MSKPSKKLAEAGGKLSSLRTARPYNPEDRTLRGLYEFDPELFLVLRVMNFCTINTSFFLNLVFKFYCDISDSSYYASL